MTFKYESLCILFGQAFRLNKTCWFCFCNSQVAHVTAQHFNNQCTVTSGDP